MAKVIIVDSRKVNAALEKYEKLLSADPILQEQQRRLEHQAAEEKNQRDKEHRQRLAASNPTPVEKPPDHDLTTGKGE